MVVMNLVSTTWATLTSLPWLYDHMADVDEAVEP
jgi:hypothetical protein